MPADVTIRQDGTAEAFSVRQNMWWDDAGRFTIENAPKTVAEAMKLSGTDFEIVAAQDFQFIGTAEDGRTVYDPEQAALVGGERVGEWVKNPNKVRWVRSDNGLVLHVPNKTSVNVPNEAAFELAYAIVDEDTSGKAQVVTAGSLYGGKQVWVLVELSEPVVIKGDTSTTLPFLCIKLYHDGLGALRAEFTMIRVQCANTWKMSDSLADRLNTALSIRHAGNWPERLREAKIGLNLVRAEMETYETFMNRLAEIPFSTVMIDKLLEEVFPAPLSTDASKAVLSNVERDRQIFRDTCNGPNLNGIEDTGYKMLMAGTEYLDWTRKTIKTGIVQRTLFAPTDRKEKVLAAIGRVADVDVKALQRVEHASRVIG